MSLAETLQLNGQISINPSPACGDDADLGTTVTLDESMSIDAKLASAFLLTADADFPIDLTAVPNVNALVIDVGSKVKLTITTADGAVQVLPVDPLMVWFSESVPITALSLTRLPGVATNVRLVLGQKA